MKALLQESPVKLLAKGSGLLLLASALVLALPAQAEMRITHAYGNVYMITGAGANVTVSAGHDGVLVVDSGSGAMSDELIAKIREISTGPIRYVINTSVSRDAVGGNPALKAAGDTFTGGNATVLEGVGQGATIISHETALHRMVVENTVEPEGWPTDVFHVNSYDLYFNGEPVLLMYQPNAVDQTNIMVHFRRSDVVSTGNLFRLDSYPVFDMSNGGSINGILASLNFLIDLSVTDLLAEGGTMLIPGYGRLSDQGDLVRYRDMVTIVRDRVQHLMHEGYSLQQIIDAKPSLDYDSRYATADYTAEMFIEAVYNSLSS